MKVDDRERRREAKRLARMYLKKLSLNDGIPYLHITSHIRVPGDGIVAVTLELYEDGKSYTASGGAKCNRTDTWDDILGCQIACGRAMLRIAYQILKDRRESVQTQKVSEAEDVRASFAKAMDIINEQNGKPEMTIFSPVLGTKKAFEKSFNEVNGITPEPSIDAISKMKEIDLLPKDEE